MTSLVRATREVYGDENMMNEMGEREILEEMKWAEARGP